MRPSPSTPATGTATGGSSATTLDRVLRDEAPRAKVRGSRRRRVLSVLVAAGAASAALALAPRAGPAGSPQALRSAAPEADTLAARARALRSADPRRAEELIARCLEAEPGRDDWRVERGLLLWATGRGGAAREEWGRVAPGSPEARWSTLYRGFERLFQNDVASARPDLEAVEASPGRDGRLARGALAAIRRDWAGARGALREEAGWEAALLRGFVETWDPRGDPAAAVRAYDEGLREGLDFTWALGNRAVAKRAIGDLPGALADLERALALDPEDPRSLVNRGQARSEAGDVAGARADFDLVLARDPRSKDALNNRGLLRESVGDLAGAIADYDAALAVAPGSKEELVNRGVARWRTGDLPAALADFDAALAADPSFPGALSNRGVVKGHLGDLAGAIADFDAALVLEPGNSNALSNRGHARWLLGDAARAVPDLERALAAAPPSWDTRERTEQDLAAARAALASGGSR